MTAARFYSSTAGLMTLQADITATSSSMSVDSTVGLPGTTPFALVIDPGNAEEIVDVTSVSGTTLVITRAVDGTPAQSHPAGVTVRHMATARDFREPQEHIGNTVAHGTIGDVVGTGNTQALINKDLSSGTNTFPSSLTTDTELAAEAALRVAHENDTSVHGVLGDVVGTTDTQTLSGKTIQAGLFTPSGPTGAALTAKGATGQSASLQVWRDINDVTLAFVGQDGVISNNSGNVGCIFFGHASTPTTYQAQISGKDPTKFVLNINGPSGQSFDLLRLAVNTVRVAGFQADGTLDAPNIPASGVAGTSTTKAGKRLHWGAKTNVTLTGLGDATITHGAGFTPTHVGITPAIVGLTWAVDNITSTTFQVHFRLSAGGGYTTPIDFSYLCGE